MALADLNADPPSESEGSISLSLEDNGPQKAVKILKTREKRTVCLYRILVFLLIGVIAAVVGSVVYFIAKEQQVNGQEWEFHGYAEETLQAASNSIESASSQLESLSKTITIFAMESNQAWPNVTQAYFQSLVTVDSASDMTFFAPLIKNDRIHEWESYAVANQWWTNQGSNKTAAEVGPIPNEVFSSPADTIHNNDSERLIIWQYGSGLKDAGLVMMDITSNEKLYVGAREAIDSRRTVMSEPLDATYMLNHTLNCNTSAVNAQSFLVHPVFETLEPNATVVGVVASLLLWDTILKIGFPEAMADLVVQVDSRSESFAYIVSGPAAAQLDGRDAEHPLWDPSNQQRIPAATRSVEQGSYNMSVFRPCPSHSVQIQSYSNLPISYMLVAVSIFVGIALVFFSYDCVLRKLQNKLENAAQRSGAIVTSLFPEEVGEQLMRVAGDMHKSRAELIKSASASHGRRGTNLGFSSAPIAELVPEVTVMFGDIVGFTAWSSSRDPSDVFTLLETLYGEFDILAQRRGVFKVETIGDCYVAVCGLPKPCVQHHIVMGKFANDCLRMLRFVAEDLAVTLGNDTKNLGMRIGLHSGPVTAGVLRGDRARFQLFGDTMNTTSRIESQGQPDRIHISMQTAELMMACGKSHWITPRADKVEAKGKGTLQTYWLDPKNDDTRSSSSGFGEPSSLESSTLPSTTLDPSRLVEWNVEVLSRFIKAVIVLRKRKAAAAGAQSCPEMELAQLEQQASMTRPLEEARNYREMNAISDLNNSSSGDSGVDDVILSVAIKEQLLDLVETIQALYNENRFHNFEHASHVTMSTVRLLQQMHEAATSNPSGGLSLSANVQLAMVLAALSHDIDHRGVPNAQLVKESSDLASVYRGASVAEQNSVDIVWQLLMEDSYKELRRAFYSTKEELIQFRQVMVTAVLATDVMDPALNQERKEHWTRLFEENPEEAVSQANANKMSAAAMGHLIRVADISHTMQPWEVYRKWNTCLFLEMHHAYQQGRGPDPSEFWYNGELSFFDHYVIPLATRTDVCSAFGSHRHQYLVSANENRQRWASEGRSLVEELKSLALSLQK